MMLEITRRHTPSLASMLEIFVNNILSSSIKRIINLGKFVDFHISPVMNEILNTHPKHAIIFEFDTQSLDEFWSPLGAVI